MALLPTTAASIPPGRIVAEAPWLDYAVDFFSTGDFPLSVDLLPTHPLHRGGLRLAVGLDEEPPSIIQVEVKDSSETWAQAVLEARLTARATLRVPRPGPHQVRLYALDPGVVVEKLVVDCGGVSPSYLGPKETVLIEQSQRACLRQPN